MTQEILERTKLHLGEYLELNLSHVTADSKLGLIAPGLDSLKTFEAVLYLEECFDVRIGDDVLNRVETVGDLVCLIEAAFELTSRPLGVLNRP